MLEPLIWDDLRRDEFQSCVLSDLLLRDLLSIHRCRHIAYCTCVQYAICSTEFSDEINVGRRCREIFGEENVSNIGFLTNRGTGECSILS